MLEAIRKRTSSLVVKLLFVLLILSFGLWGVADVLSPTPRDQWAAKVADVTISTEAMSEQYQQELRRLQQVLGQRFDADQARALGLPQRVLGQMIDRTLIDLEATDLGLVISDQLVRQEIVNDERFRNALGQFDPEVFRQSLAATGLTEEMFVSWVRNDIARGQVIDSIVAGVTTPRPVLDALYRHRNEKRSGEFITVNGSKLATVGDPGDQVLRSFFDENEPLFTAPEYRSVAAVVLSARELAQDTSVPSEKVRAAYDERSGEFSQPERRAILQIVFASEEQARAALTQINAGADFFAVARDRAGLDISAVDLGIVTREQLLPPLADAAFSAAAGTIAGPVKSELGWHVIRITKIEPSRKPSFDEVKEKLAADLAKDLAVENLYDLGNKLEDALGQGSSLEDAARQLGLKTMQLAAIDPQGKDPAGARLEGLPPRLVEAAFATQEGAESPLIEADNETFFVLRVNKVTPSAVKPFETVRDQVLAAWQEGERRRRAKDIADGLLARINAGSALVAVAADRQLPVTRTPAVSRTGAGIDKDTPREVAAALFETPPGQATVVVGAEAVYVVRTLRVIPADPGADSASLDTLRKNLASAESNDLIGQLTAGLRQHHRVTINDLALDRL